MAPATLQLVLGVMEVLLRVAGFVMALGVIFLFYLHSFAARTARNSTEHESSSLALQLSVPRPSPFILRSTRPSPAPTLPGPIRQRRAA